MNRKVGDYYLEVDDDADSFTLPSQREKTTSKSSSKKKTTHHHKPKKTKTKRTRSRTPSVTVQMPKNFKIFAILIALVVIYFTYNSIVFYLLEALKANPQLYNFYLYMESEIANNTIKGLLVMATLGSLFFLSLPSEILFIYYLSAVDKNIVVLLGIMVLGNILGLAFNYIFGWLIGQRVLQLLFRKNFQKYQNLIFRYGGVFLLFGNILPGPVEVLSVFYGGFRYNFRYYLYLCLIGRLIKFLLLIFLYIMFWDQLVYYYEILVDNFLVLKDFYGI